MEEAESSRGTRSAACATALGFAFVIAGCAANELRSRTSSSRAEAEEAVAQGDWNLAAERWYGVFVKEGRVSSDACGNAARALVKLEDYDGAIQMLDSGLANDPENADLLELKGQSLVGLGFRRAAEECYERVVALDPARRNAWLALGKVRIDLGLEGKAVGPLEKALARGGDYATWRLLAQALRASGEACGAFRAYVSAFEAGTGTTEDLVLAASLFSDADVRRAHPEAERCMTAWLEKAIALDPQCSNAHFQLGVINEELRRPERAVEHYRRAIEVDPSSLIALTNLAILYDSLGDSRSVRPIVERALEIESDPDRKRALQRLLEKNLETKAAAK